MPRWPLLLSPPAVSTSPSRSRLPRRPSPSLSPPVSSSAVATGVFVARRHCGGARWQHGGGGGCRGHARLHRATDQLPAAAAAALPVATATRASRGGAAADDATRAPSCQAGRRHRVGEEDMDDINELAELEMKMFGKIIDNIIS